LWDIKYDGEAAHKTRDECSELALAEAPSVARIDQAEHKPELVLCRYTPRKQYACEHDLFHRDPNSGQVCLCVAIGSERFSTSDVEDTDDVDRVRFPQAKYSQELNTINYFGRGGNRTHEVAQFVEARNPECEGPVLQRSESSARVASNDSFPKA
jgi:hypothetical protein